MESKSVSEACLNRLPIYLNYLLSLPQDKDKQISATLIARSLGLGEVQVRKDLSSVCSLGRPKTGYLIASLIDAIQDYLEFNKTDNAIIVGAGKLGRALLDYEGFSACGLNVLAAFDNDSNKAVTKDSKKPIMNITEIKKFCNANSIKIGIITVPASSAQEVCVIMGDCGIRAIMNFAPVHLIPPEHVSVRNENIAASLALLSKSINQNI